MLGFKSSRNNYSGGFTGLIDGIDSWEGVSRGLTRGYPGFTKDFGVIPGHRDGVFLGFTRGYPGLGNGVSRGFTRGYPGLEMGYPGVQDELWEEFLCIFPFAIVVWHT